jgi:hypothetical protein
MECRVPISFCRRSRHSRPYTMKNVLPNISWNQYTNFKISICIRTKPTPNKIFWRKVKFIAARVIKIGPRPQSGPQHQGFDASMQFNHDWDSVKCFWERFNAISSFATRFQPQLRTLITKYHLFRHYNYNIYNCNGPLVSSQFQRASPYKALIWL